MCDTFCSTTYGFCWCNYLLVYVVLYCDNGLNGLHVVKLTDKNQQVVSLMELFFFSQKPDSDFSTADKSLIL